MTDEEGGRPATHEWARRYQVAWEVETISEAVKGHGVRQTGVELRLFGSPPVQEGAFAALHEQMRKLVQEVLPAEQDIHVQVEPFEPKAHLRPETGYVPEVQLTVRITPAQSEHQPDPAHVRQLLAHMEGALKELGLQPKVWPHRS